MTKQHVHITRAHGLNFHTHSIIEMSGGADSSNGLVKRKGGRTYMHAHMHVPLNWKQLTADQLCCLVMALEVPLSDSPADT